MINSSPPLLQQYRALLKLHSAVQNEKQNGAVMEECELPLIDIRCLINAGCKDGNNEKERVACMEAICQASSEWGFFQVVNHGISPKLLRGMRAEQIKLFETSFEKKSTCGLLNNSYRWGNQAASNPIQFSWSEAFHVPLTKISEDTCYGEFTSLRDVMQEIAGAMSRLASLLANVLAERLCSQRRPFEEITCFLRLNHYLPCPASVEMHGLVTHTDSDFLTILCQDHVGGLQLMKDSKWVAVKPMPDALIVNIGDLFQVWSNNIYKSVYHRVMANDKADRYSIAYFLCPSNDTLIGSCKEPSVYRKFTFGQYRNQIQRDTKETGSKVGLPRFLL
ncbi:Isopenicillin N synthase-like, Fe(2+) 2OG dioxygenase domain [Dillenia turbinata]|uniref:Isopenicillin N synthase-like, Fe(2+) 2OG dioxygenase domain n=1 Tax=Dillenia turbinata TaxID=194707 RepID=A0AAN8VBC4_9MAGN